MSDFEPPTWYEYRGNLRYLSTPPTPKGVLRIQYYSDSNPSDFRGLIEMMYNSSFLAEKTVFESGRKTISITKNRYGNKPIFELGNISIEDARMYNLYSIMTIYELAAWKKEQLKAISS